MANGYFSLTVFTFHFNFLGSNTSEKNEYLKKERGKEKYEIDKSIETNLRIKQDDANETKI